MGKKVLASRWKRLVAAFIDGSIVMLISSPVMYFTGGFDGFKSGIKPSMTYNLLIGIFALIVFVLINSKLLKNHGQTIGKKILGIRISPLNEGGLSVKKHLLKRYAIFLIPGKVPIIGQIFSVINILFIFGKQKRCIHDRVADTVVVDS